jgi:hypothetical protein
MYIFLGLTKESPSGHFQCGPSFVVGFVGGSHDEVPSLRFQ